jgi:hypothetical protein
MNWRDFITPLGGAVVVAYCGPRVPGAWSDHVHPHRVPVAAGRKGSELILVISSQR